MAILLLTLFVYGSCFQQAIAYAPHTQNTISETPESVISDGATAKPDCEVCQLPPPPPPPPACEPPPPACAPPPPKCRPRLPRELRRAKRTIGKFSKTITSDPQGITKTWRGYGICTDANYYKGFVCDRFPADNRLRVAGVKFNGFNFSGNPLNISGLLEELNDLAFFHANSNFFTGEIPTNIDKIPYFYELDVSNNKLQGTFPTSVLAAKNLTFLDLRFNSLTGTLPAEVFTMDLDVLFLNNNQFLGDIPDSLGQTPALYLTLANNKFTGPIPKTIGQANDTLVEVLFLNNNLSSCLPYEIGLLNKSTVFDASQNQLTGPIPQSFGCLEKMQRLNLASNQFYGPVPECLCKLKNMSNLTLSDNYFTQVGPHCRNLIMKKVLDVSMNCILDLPLQKSAAQCQAFFLMRKTCPDRSSLSYVPCQIDDSAPKEVTSYDDEALPPPVPAPSPSYAALELHA